MKFKFLFSLAVFALVFSSCTKNDATPNEELVSSEMVTEPISQEELDFMNSLRVNLDDAELVTTEYPDGTKEEVYIVEGDVMIQKEQYEKLTQPDNDTELRQWYTGQTVNNWQTINVLGYNSNNYYGLSNNMKTALSYAIWNYNNLNIGLNFSHTFGTNTGPADIVVFRYGSGSGGIAGFPSGGVPHKWVQIQTGLDNANYNTIEHVITHEIAHCLGMRHNDWMNRASCGQNLNEGGPAYQIPGTAYSQDYLSLFNSCYHYNTSGEFNANDRKMMEYLY